MSDKVAKTKRAGGDSDDSAPEVKRGRGRPKKDDSEKVGVKPHLSQHLSVWKLFARWQLVFLSEIFLVKIIKFFGLKKFFESAQLVKVSARCQ